MAHCTVSDSPEIARRAARTFFWRKFKSPAGALYVLSALVFMPGIIAALLLLEGANWLVGVFGLMLFMNVLLQYSAYVWAPRALAARAADPSRQGIEIETSEQGFKASAGGNSSTMAWNRFKHIWVYEDFVLLVRAEPIFSGFASIPTAGMTAEVRADFLAAAASRLTKVRAGRYG